MIFTVTLKPTLHEDEGAVGRLLDALVGKTGLGYPQIVGGFLAVQSAIKENARAGRCTRLRMEAVDGRLSVQVVP